MAPSDYERFQQSMFDQIDDLERADKQRMLVGFYELGRSLGIDIVAEIKRKGEPVSDVVDRVLLAAAQKLTKS
jgi:hypothetical protein